MDNVQLRQLIDRTGSLFSKEKQKRIGTARQGEEERLLLIITSGGKIFGLRGALPVNDAAEHSVFIRCLVPVFNATAMIDIAEAWVAEKCNKCAEGFALDDPPPECPQCGTKIVRPSENPYRQEVLMGVFNAPKGNGRLWISVIRRGADDHITGFEDRQCGEPSKFLGPCGDIFSIEEWMRPHIAINVPIIASALDMPVPALAAEAAKKLEEQAKQQTPPFEFIRFDPARIHQHQRNG